MSLIKRIFIILIMATAVFSSVCRAADMKTGAPPAAATASAKTPEIAETATPTIAASNRAVSRGDVVPDDIKTQEDYNLPFDTGPEPPRASIWRVIGSLSIIAILIVGAVYLMRLMLARGMRYDLRGKHIKVIDVVQLGVNRSLYLVLVGKKTLLLGSTEKGLRFIADITGAEESGEAAGETGGVEFSDALREAASQEQERTAESENFLARLKEKLKRFEDDRHSE